MICRAVLLPPDSRSLVTEFYTDRVLADDWADQGGALGLYFFLSYAHGDPADDDRVERFFADLSTEIRALTGDDQGEVVGFHDFRSLRVGDPWPRELIEALSTARTFVPLLSPRYLRSQYCGKEWTVFARRVDVYEIEKGRRPPSIIPVFWVRTELPPELRDLHQRDRSFGEPYHTKGLRDLLRLGQERETAEFVGALAQRVLDVAGRFPLPPMDQRPDLHKVPSAFEPAEPPVAGAGDPLVLPLPRPDPDKPPGEWPSTRRPIFELDYGDPPDQQ